MEDSTVYTAIIVDDEQHARANLAMMLADYCPDIRVVADASSVEEAVRVVDANRPQFIFLDIRMPSGAEGFTLLRQLPDYPYLVVFVTAFRDYALQALNANAVHYLLKPVDPEDLQTAAEKLRKLVGNIRSNPNEHQAYQEKLWQFLEELYGERQRIAIHHARGIRMVRVADIAYVQAEGNCALIVQRDGSRYLDTRTLKVYEELLIAPTFQRVHRSYLVNMQCVSELIRNDHPELLLADGTRIPVSRSRLPEVIEALSASR